MAQVGKSHNYRDIVVFQMLRLKGFRLFFPPHENVKPVISVDGRPNRRNKAAFLNISGVVWTQLESGEILHASRLKSIFAS